MSTVVSSGLLSPVTTNETQQTDNSRAYSLADYSTGAQVGLRITAGDLSGATIQSVDPGALMAAQSIAQQAIEGNTVSTSRIAGAANLALTKAFDLAGQASQTDTQAVLGTIVKVVLALVGLGAVAGLFWWLSKREKSK